MVKDLLYYSLQWGGMGQMGVKKIMICNQESNSETIKDYIYRFTHKHSVIVIHLFELRIKMSWLMWTAIIKTIGVPGWKQHHFNWNGQKRANL